MVLRNAVVLTLIVLILLYLLLEPSVRRLHLVMTPFQPHYLMEFLILRSLTTEPRGLMYGMVMKLYQLSILVEITLTRLATNRLMTLKSLN